MKEVAKSIKIQQFAEFCALSEENERSLFTLHLVTVVFGTVAQKEQQRICFAEKCVGGVCNVLKIVLKVRTC